MDNPAAGLIDTIGQRVMAPARQGMDLLQNMDPAIVQQLLARLGIGGSPAPSLPMPMGGGRDIQLPNQSGRVDPRLRREMMLSQLKGGQ